jgi:hypothetical protein
MLFVLTAAGLLAGVLAGILGLLAGLLAPTLLMLAGLVLPALLVLAATLLVSALLAGIVVLGVLIHHVLSCCPCVLSLAPQSNKIAKQRFQSRQYQHP